MAIVVLLLYAVVHTAYGNSLKQSDNCLSNIDETVRNHVQEIRNEFRIQFEKLEKENSALRTDLVTLRTEVSVLKTKAQLGQQTIRSLPTNDLTSPNTLQSTSEIESNVTHNKRRKTRVAPIRSLQLLDQTEIVIYMWLNSVKAKNSYHDKGDEHAPQVAFQAKLDNSQLTIGNSQTIKFHAVDFNLGDAYNHQTGVFTCLIPGTYMFHLTMVVDLGKYAQFYLVKNGHDFGRLFVGNQNHTGSSSTSSLIELEAQDNVWIESTTVHSTGNVMKYSWSYFSGVLLFQRI
ncbi:uncharacterized protein LOC132556209 [Ylistrum balloti]|uniref:uncharacterized protein LOC132556209 n=1 Tax=Ylistrum balloti TaxID=509963 RepID=UPI002905E6A6|nr:uncharacterized protein LOC132556209 [Ylistrum balloti]